MEHSLFELKNVSIRRYSQTLLENINWAIAQGEHWALVGPSGSGKTTLLHALRTMAYVSNGEVHYPMLESLVTKYQHSDPYFSFKDLIAIVSAKYNFRDLTGTSTNMYYQQRYNSLDSESVETVKDHLEKLRPFEGEGYWNFDRVVERLRLKALMDKTLIKLSNGEAKRLLIASELIKNPVLLLMDNPLAGLDPDTRKDMNRIIHEIGESGINTVMVTSRHEIPDLITHVASIWEGKVQVGTKREFDNHEFVREVSKSLDEKALIRLLARKHQPFELVVKMNKVSVSYGENLILDQVDWEVKQKERWLVKGHNGAGKSTLLSLITADNPQSYSKDIILFDKKRGTGESIWDIKKKIGMVSAELFQYFPSHSTCLKVVESGFYDTMGLFKPSQPENAQAMEWLEVLQIANQANTLFRNLPESMQRLALLARALVKDPPLLILDEPGQGLDLDQQYFFKELIEAVCNLSDITIIYVSHFQEEIPECFTHQLALEKGKVMQNQPINR
ncbi:MAG: ATP-binding cassette domain-containing protein [Bacteroidota bacterium]